MQFEAACAGHAHHSDAVSLALDGDATAVEISLRTIVGVMRGELEPGAEPESFSPLTDRVIAAFRLAHERVIAANAGVCSVVAMVLHDGVHVSIMHAGNIRAFRWRAELDQFLEPHTLETELRLREQLGDMASTDPPVVHESGMTRGIGITSSALTAHAEPGLSLDVSRIDFARDDIFVLCAGGSATPSWLDGLPPTAEAPDVRTICDELRDVPSRIVLRRRS